MTDDTDQERVSNAVLLWTAMDVLRNAAEPMNGRDVLARMSERLSFTPYWLESYSSGQLRWIVGVHFFTGDAATIGWMTKRGGWSITEAGLAAMDTFDTPGALFAERGRRYSQIDQRRKKAQQNLGAVQQFIARTLALVETGSWTAFDDIAALAGTTANEVADFLASGKIRLANAYRVLTADGSIPPEGMLNAVYRGSDLRTRLEDEGVEFNADGKADQVQRLTADALKDLHAADLDAETDAQTPAGRAWMVRGRTLTGQPGAGVAARWVRLAERVAARGDRSRRLARGTAAAG